MIRDAPWTLLKALHLYGPGSTDEHVVAAAIDRLRSLPDDIDRLDIAAAVIRAAQVPACVARDVFDDHPIGLLSVLADLDPATVPDDFVSRLVERLPSDHLPVLARFELPAD